MDCLRQIFKCGIAGTCRYLGVLAAAERRSHERLTILCYHRVLPAERKHAYFAAELVVTPESFREHCRTLSKHYNVLPLTEAVATWRTGDSARRPPAAITLDDGYQDNYKYAAPILAEFGLRATFFVITSLVGTQQTPWYDRVARAYQFLARDERARHILHVAGFPDGFGSTTALVAAAKSWEPCVRARLVQCLERAVDGEDGSSACDHVMTWRQLRELGKAGHEIGSHSHTHAILTQLSDGELEDEIVTSHGILLERLGGAHRAFCYPNGNCDERVIEAVRRAGYRCAVTVATRVNSPGDDPFRLGRWFIHEKRLSSPLGRPSGALLRLEVSQLAERAFFRRRWRQAASEGSRRSKSRNAARRLGYFTNIYPAVSHTFIRREIETLESLGWEIARFAIRRDEGIVDAHDREEAAQTSYLLPFRIGELSRAGWLLAARPVRVLRGFWQGLQMAWREERPIWRAVAIIPEAMILLRRLKRSRISFVHGHFGTNPASILRLVRTFGGPPYSFTNHGPFQLNDPKANVLLEKLHDATFVAVISDFSRVQMERISTPATRSKIHVVRCGLRFDDVAPTSVPASRRLLCVARLSAEKGHLTLLLAAKRIAEEQLGLELLLVGDGPLRPMLERETHRLGLTRCVRFCGTVAGKRVTELLESSRALVLPSLAEGLPVVIMEAFRACRPVIASRVGAVPELVEAGRSGWLVPPGNPVALGEATREALMASPERLSEMGRAGYQAVRVRHNVLRETSKLARLFELSTQGM